MCVIFLYRIFGRSKLNRFGISCFIFTHFVFFHFRSSSKLVCIRWERHDRSPSPKNTVRPKWTKLSVWREKEITEIICHVRCTCNGIGARKKSIFENCCHSWKTKEAFLLVCRLPTSLTKHTHTHIYLAESSIEMCSNAAMIPTTTMPSMTTTTITAAEATWNVFVSCYFNLSFVIIIVELSCR